MNNTKWGGGMEWELVQENPPLHAQFSNGCGPATAYNMVLLDQDQPIAHDPNLLSTLRQWV